MSCLYHETEHQELFYLQVDLHQPLAVHVPSALGPLGYFVCLRVPEAQAGALGHVTVQAKLTGLRCTDQTVPAGAGLDGQTSVPAATDGLVWVFLCRINMARGDGVVTFSGVPADLGAVDLLFCTWPRYVTSGQADQWIAGQADPNWAPSGVPLGGIGTGRVDLCRDGRFRHYSGNNNQDMPLEDPDGLPGAFLSVAVAGRERLLATRPAAGLQPCRTLHFEPAFPQAVLAAPEIFPGLDVAVTCSGPLIPHDLRTSSMPCALLRWRLVNRGARAFKVRCRLAWPNLVGTGGGLGAPERRIGYGDGFYRFWEAPEAPQARARNLGGLRVLEYSNHPSPVSASADGRHYVALQRGAGHTFVDCDPRRGSVAQTVTVAPGGTADTRMALVWEMPHGIDSLGVDRGLHWQNHFADGRAMLHEIFASFDAMLERTGALRRLLAETDLPDWLQSRLPNCCYPLVTNSVFYRDGRFSINEGPTEMSGVLGTIDQRLAAHPATQLLFPELNRRELKQFAATMTASGEVNHDLGAGHLESPPRGQRWPDIQCSFVLQHARHAWTTGDAAFETESWPLVRRAIERHAQWAEEGRGVPQLGRGTGLGTSYDSYHYEGTTAYIGTLWIAALQVAGKWAESAGDHEFPPRAARWISAARQRLDEDLWNGTFYRAYAGAGVASNENCHAGMLAGEYYARLLAGTDVLPPERLASCADALLALQGSARFAVPPDEVSPDGGAGSLYGWLPYIESFCLAPLAVLGRPGVLAIWERTVRAMSGGNRQPCDTRLMYRPLTGGPSWGAFYMTAPASWLVYDALLDFSYAPRAEVLRLIPRFEGRFVVVHPLFWALGWREGARVSLQVRQVFAPASPAVGWLETAPGARALRVNGLPADPAGTGGLYARFRMPQWVLNPGAEINWEIL